MSLRIRKDRKKIVCAAFSKPLKGDCYINDDVQYVLHQEMKVLHTDDGGETWYIKGGNMSNKDYKDWAEGSVDRIMGEKIGAMLSDFWVSVGSSEVGVADKKFNDRFNKRLESYTKKFLKLCKWYERIEK